MASVGDTVRTYFKIVVDGRTSPVELEWEPAVAAARFLEKWHDVRIERVHSNQVSGRPRAYSHR